jgi:hypothetical protein
MTKVFSADYKSGTFIDSVNKIVGVPTSLSKLIRTEKGAALARVVNHDGVTYTTGSKSLSKFTIVAWIKKRTTNTDERYTIAYIGNTQIIRELSLGTYNNYFNGALRGSISIPITTSLNKWMQFVVTYDGVNFVSSVNNKQIVGSPSATTATLDFTSIIVGRGTSNSRCSDSDILKFEIYDNVLSDKEIELDYKALLDTQITEKPVRGFELVKPTDLSYLKDTGLIAAYNMIPNGNTLVDISGNNNNATIFDVVNTKRGLSFNGRGSTVITSMTANTAFAGGYTILARIKPRSFGGSSAGRIVDKSEGASGSKGFYLALGSSAQDIVYNDGGTVVRSTSNIIQLGQEQTIAMTMASNNIMFFYHNGIAAGTASKAHNYITSAPLTIGNRAGATDRAFDGEIQDIRIYNRVLTEQEIKDYHNSFVKPAILEDWSNYAVGNTMPNEWIINSGAFVIAETTRKYLACTSNGTISINYPTTNTSVYASIEYYNGTSWITYTGLLSDLISTHAWMNLTGGYLEFTLTTSTRLGNIKIFDGVRV